MLHQFGIRAGFSGTALHWQWQQGVPESIEADCDREREDLMLRIAEEIHSISNQVTSLEAWREASIIIMKLKW